MAMKRASILMCCALAVLSAAGVNLQQLFQLGGILPGHDPSEVDSYSEYISESGSVGQSNPSFTFTATPPANSGLRVKDWLVAGDGDDIKLGRSNVQSFDAYSDTMTWTLNRAFETDGTLYVAARFYYITNSVSFYGNASGAYGATASTGSQCFTNSYELTANGFTLTGYTFSNWTNEVGKSFADSQVVTGSDLSVSNNLQVANLYAVWTPNGYAVTYNLDGGTHGSAHPSQATFDTVFEVSDPTRTGYAFGGWTISSGLNTGTAKYGSSKSSVSSSIATTTLCRGSNGSTWFMNLTPAPAGAVTVKANWTANQTSVHFNNFDADAGQSDKTFTYGEALTSVTVAKWNDGSRRFLGYYTTQGERYWDEKGQPVKSTWDIDAANCTFEARFESTSYFITYDPNGGDGTAFSIAFTNGVALTLWDGASFFRAGSELLGWAMLPTLLSPQYALGAEATFDGVSGDFSLYAVWKDYYYVAFDGNGATNETPMAVQEFEFGEEKALSANEYGRVGYDFAGWAADAASAAALKIAHADCEVVQNLEKTHGATNTLVAAWRPISYVADFYISSSRSSEKLSPVDCTYDVAFKLPVLEYKAGDLWKHIGWSNIVDNVVYYNTEVSAVSNLCTTANATNTLVAVWESTVSDLSEAMDVYNLVWSNEVAEAGWRIEAEGYDTSSCVAQTGLVTTRPVQRWRMTTSVTNSGTLAFWWRTKEGNAALRFSRVHGSDTTNVTLVASTEWVKATVRVQMLDAIYGDACSLFFGPYDGNTSETDTIYIDRMTWTPDGSSGEPDVPTLVSVPEIASKTYSGGTLTPDVSDGENYKVLKTASGVDVGTYEVTLGLTGSNTAWADGAEDVRTVSWQIVAKPLKSAMLGSIADQTYTGQAIEAEPAVTDSDRGATLTKGTDYELSWTNNVEVGTATVTVTGKGNYSGSVSAKFTIKAAEVEPVIILVAVPKVESKTYSGATLTADIANGENYEVVQNVGGVDVGTYEVTLGLTGSNTAWADGAEKIRTVSWQIVAKPLKSAMLGSIADQTYTGQAIEAEPAVTDSDRGATLAKGTDYELSWANNVEVGTATVTVTGKGNYSGSVSAKFTIKAAEVEPGPGPGDDEPDPPEPPTVVQPWTATKATVLYGAVYDDAGVVAGVVQLKVGKPNARKRTAKLSGYIMGSDGKKRTIKSATVPVPDDEPITAELLVKFTSKDLRPLSVTVGDDGFAGEFDGMTVMPASIGGDWTRTDASVFVDFGDSDLPDGAVEELLPNEDSGEAIIPKRGKWSFAKAASVKWAKDKATKEYSLVVNTSKNKTNLSAMKLTYTPKTGVFKGSFKIYALVTSGSKTKLKKYTVKVAGFVVGGEGVGMATLSKPAATWDVFVK